MLAGMTFRARIALPSGCILPAMGEPSRVDPVFAPGSLRSNDAGRP